MSVDQQEMARVILALGKAGEMNFTDALEESLQSRPLTTLALAVGIGFVFGATWRR